MSVWIVIGAGLASWTAEASLDDVPLTVDPQEAEAHTAVVSLPVPKDEATQLYGSSPAFSLNGDAVSAKPLAWWTRDEVPRRVFLYRAGDSAIGKDVRLQARPGSTRAPGRPWKVTYQPFNENPYSGYKVVLRGGTHAESMSEWDDLVLNYKGKEFTLRMGTRRDKFHASAAFAGTHDWWQWNRVEPIWESADVQLFRVCGLLYNEDSFMHCDLYLELFANGVGRAYAHFVNARVIGDGWEYFGIPVIGFGSATLKAVDLSLDGTKTRFDLGDGLSLDIRDSADLIGNDHPGRLYSEAQLTVYQPWEDQRVTDKEESYGKRYVADFGDATMLRGLARTVRFTFSLSDAPPRVAQLAAPAWLHAQAKEIFPQPYLPARWRLGHTPPQIAQGIAQPDARYHGTFEGGYSDRASEGKGGLVMIYGSYYGEDPYLLRRGITWSYNWTDIMLDHIDWSIRQVYTGYYWKTSTYSKFADMICGWLETGDPYLLESAEHAAGAYYALMRSTWPARSMGRGILPVQDLILLYKYTRNPVYFERALEIIERSIVSYSDPDQFPGHNIGVGPNGIGNWITPMAVGFAELSLARTAIDAAQCDTELIDEAERERLLVHAERVVRYVLEALAIKGDNDPGGWIHYETGMLIVTELPLAIDRGQADLAIDLEKWIAADEAYQSSASAGRPYHAILGRPLYDAATLNATWQAGELVIDPLWLPEAADGRTAEIDTPMGTVTLRMQRAKNVWQFEAVDEPAPVIRVVDAAPETPRPAAAPYKPGPRYAQGK